MNTPHSIGDRVRVNCPGSECHGREATITSELVRGFCELRDRYFLGHAIDIPISGIKEFSYGFEPHELIPIYDGNEKTTWEECVWKPQEVRA